MFSKERKDENFLVESKHFLFGFTKNSSFQIGEKTKVKAPISKQ